MKFSELAKCPFCGSEKYYMNCYCFGRVRCNLRFDGEEADNTTMYDGLSIKQLKRVYCFHCKKYLGDIEADTVGKEAAKVLAEEAK